MPAQGDLASARRCWGLKTSRDPAGAGPNQGYAALKLATKACPCSPFLSVKLPRAMPPSSAIAADLPRTRGSPRVASWAGQLAAVFPGSRGRFSKKLGEAIDRLTHITIRSQYNYSWKCDAGAVHAVTFKTLPSVSPRRAPRQTLTYARAHGLTGVAVLFRIPIRDAI